MESMINSPRKLTRTNSSLLRSSPTVRSSIHSLSSVNEISAGQEVSDVEEQKLHDKSGSRPFKRAYSLLASVLALVCLSIYTVLAFFSRSYIPTSENLLLALIFVAFFLYFIAKSKDAVNKGASACKQLCEECAQRLGLPFLHRKTHPEPVQWFIGEFDSYEIERQNQSKAGSGAEKMVKEGVEFHSNGDFYEGEFHKGRCSGSGVYYYFANGRYEGDWIDGKYDGYGIESWAKGSRYRGQYRHGSRHGYGIYKFYTGDTYAGEWHNGQSHGIGIQTCSDGSSYIGQFKCGVKHGLGCYHFRNGDRYAGEYFGDKIHGFGVYHFGNNSHRYEGSWHEGRKQGFGMYSFRNGDRRCGEWDGGDLKVPLPPPSHPVLKAVQSARTAAENAAKLGSVEERVNRAVEGANRAATAARVAAIKAVQNRMDGKFAETQTDPPRKVVW
ncbi:hypothetical protein M569_02471 [Genlisea aurea]|uniref:Uncharacterized protein n=1 Tax=Genlisea aurea TaxID=192259 RepID=S8CZ43_9LAMI|nr:hypothetical protein M569_02471 [Genlisea aurea]